MNVTMTKDSFEELKRRREEAALGGGEDRIKKEVGKAASNIDASILSGTREAVRGLQGQPGFKRGAETAILNAAQQARAQGVVEVEGKLRGLDAQLEKADVQRIQDELMAMGFKQGPAARKMGMTQAADAAAAVGTATEDAIKGFQEMTDKYSAPE